MELNKQINFTVQALKLNGKFNEVRKWANERGLIQNGDVTTQRIKLFEEFGELCRAVLKDDIKEVKDAIGDCIVVMINMYAIEDLKLEDFINYDQNYICKENSVKNNISLLIGCIDLVSSDDTGGLDSCKWYVEDVFTLLAQLSLLYKTNLVECLNLAYNEIKDRKGKMVDGSFIKNE